MKSKNLITSISEYLLIKENKNYIYTNTDYERYITIKKEIVSAISNIINSNFTASTGYRNKHINDKDLIFNEMHFYRKTDGYTKIETTSPFTKEQKDDMIKYINQILNKHNINSVKIVFDDKNQRVSLTNFKDKKIKKGRKNFEYPIGGRNINFIITDRDIVPFCGVKSLKGCFDFDKTLNYDGTYKMVSFLSTHLYRFIKIDDNIYNINDVEQSYVDLFQDTYDIETETNVGTKDILYKKYLLNGLKTHNNSKILVELFDMLETTNFDFVYYDKYTDKDNYVRNI